jgi:DNA-binding CsgD family transcriptional regulator/catechol 2,3-dioxygenase-like lactoylglutathione lyase family enzyme
MAPEAPRPLARRKFEIRRRGTANVNGATRRGRPRHPDVLTPAEWRVVNAVRHGMTNRTIARRLGVSLDAVKFHVANALAKLSLSSRTELRQWRGAPRDSTLNGGTMVSGATQLGGIGQISRVVSDIKKAEAWYRDVLGLPHLFTFGTLAFFDCGGIRLFLSEPESGGVPGDSCIYFRVDDINAAHAELSGKGVKFQGAPHLIHRHENGVEEWMAFFEDPDGKILALMSQVSPSAGGGSSERRR